MRGRPIPKRPTLRCPAIQGTPAAVSGGLDAAYATSMQSGKVSVLALDSLSGLASDVVPTSVAMPDEPHSEGIDYLADGRGFVTSGEAIVRSLKRGRLEQPPVMEGYVHGLESPRTECIGPKKRAGVTQRSPWISLRAAMASVRGAIQGVPL
jgi:hypothetical protein